MPLKIYFEDEFRFIESNDNFLKTFTPITAAGGIVINDEDKILMIFRRGKWDLPKGKAEKGESMEACAEREIMEETGLSRITPDRFLITTYHTYSEKGESILKDTHWFLFRAPGEQTLKPQTEEDISQIEWVSEKELQHYTNNTYLLIRDVLDSFL